MISFNQRVRLRALGQTPSTITPAMRETFDEMAKTFLEHARPVLREDILPALRDDKELQRTVGTAIGEGVGKTLVPWVVAGFAAIVIAIVVRGRESET